jgi:hypothetical protein
MRQKLVNDVIDDDSVSISNNNSINNSLSEINNNININSKTFVLSTPNKTYTPSKIMNSNEKDIQNSSTKDQSFHIQNNILNDELSTLREEYTTISSTIADYQKQIDVSVLKITELEQHLHREEYKSKQAIDSLKISNERLNNQEIGQNTLIETMEKSMLESFEFEKEQIHNELKRNNLEKEGELKFQLNSINLLKESLKKASDDSDRYLNQVFCFSFHIDFKLIIS